MPEVTVDERAEAAVRLWFRETAVQLGDGVTSDDEAALVRIIAAAIREEREACARVADVVSRWRKPYCRVWGETIAHAIRQRGEEDHG